MKFDVITTIVLQRCEKYTMFGHLHIDLPRLTGRYFIEYKVRCSLPMAKNFMLGYMIENKFYHIALAYSVFLRNVVEYFLLCFNLVLQKKIRNFVLESYPITFIKN